MIARARSRIGIEKTINPCNREKENTFYRDVFSRDSDPVAYPFIFFPPLEVEQSQSQVDKHHSLRDPGHYLEMHENKKPRDTFREHTWNVIVEDS